MATNNIKRCSHSNVALPLFGDLLGVRRNTHKTTSTRHPILIKAHKISIRMKCPGTRIQSYANRVPKIKKRNALKRKRLAIKPKEPEPQELSISVLIRAMPYIILCGIFAFEFLKSDYGKSILPEGFSSIVESFYKFAKMCIALVEGFTAKFKEPEEIKPTWSLLISNAFGWSANPQQNQGGFLNSIWNWCAAMFGNTTALATPEVPENNNIWEYMGIYEILV